MGTVYSNVLAQLGWSWQTGAEAAPVVDNNRLIHRVELDYGQDAFQADTVWHAEGQVLGQDDHLVYDLLAMEFPVFGDKVSLCFDRVRALLIVHRGQNPGVLQIGGASNNPWQGPLGEATDHIQIPASGALWVVHPEEGWPVTPEACQLQLEAVGGDVLYDIALLGNRPTG